MCIANVSGLIDDANGVVDSFSGQIYGIVDQVLDVSRGKYITCTCTVHVLSYSTVVHNYTFF